MKRALLAIVPFALGALWPASAQQAASQLGACTPAPAFANGVEYAAGWRPYDCRTSPWNRRVSAHPRIAAYSARVIAGEFARGDTQPVRDMEAGAWDYGHPIYYAGPSDPLVNVNCDPKAYAGAKGNDTCDTADNGGLPARIRIPARARPAGGTDAHMIVIQPNGVEIDFWDARAPSGNWGTPGNMTIAAGGGASCGDWRTSSGWDPANNGWPQTAGGACLAGGLLRANELLAGHIDHALAIVLQCAIGVQYPAFPGATTDNCTSGVGPPLGGRLWYDVPDTVTGANPNLRPWERAILDALHDYGGYLMDDVQGGSAVSGMAFLAASGEPAFAFARPDPFAALAAQGWTSRRVDGSFTLRWIGADPWRPSGVDFLRHLHWLAACSAQGSC